MKSQRKAWNKIAEEWFKFRNSPQKEAVNFLKKQKGNILDLGCGSGRNFLKIEGKLYGVDFSKRMLKFAEEKAEKFNVELINAKMEKLPFKDNFFDAAIFFSSLHCVKKEEGRKAISELYRVLKSGAQAKISVWNKDSKRFKNSPKEKLIGWRNKAKRYYYFYEPEEIYEEFEKAGFRIIKKQKPEKNIIFIVEKK